MSVAAILHSASAPPLGRGRSEADFQFASSEESGVVSSLLGTVLDGLPANYGELFTRHRITDDILGQLDEPDLQRMGIELVGHQKVIVNRIRRLAAQMAALESDVDPDSKMASEGVISAKAKPTCGRRKMRDEKWLLSQVKVLDIVEHEELSMSI